MRTIVEDDKVLFCGSDVAKALGYTNSRKALADHTKAGVTIRYTDDKGVNQARKYISEGDVYRLIVSSKLPGACPFTFPGEKALRKCYTCHISTYQSKILCIQGRRICV